MICTQENAVLTISGHALTQVCAIRAGLYNLGLPAGMDKFVEPHRPHLLRGPGKLQ